MDLLYGTNKAFQPNLPPQNLRESMPIQNLTLIQRSLKKPSGNTKGLFNFDNKYKSLTASPAITIVVVALFAIPVVAVVAAVVAIAVVAVVAASFQRGIPLTYFLIATLGSPS